MSTSLTPTNFTAKKSNGPFTLTPSQKNMIAGGIAGCIAKTIVAPLSRLTVLSQVSSLFPTGNFSIPHKENVVETLRRIAKHQGVRSLWNGNFTSVIHRFPYSAINFAVFETTNKHLAQLTGKTEAVENRFISGFVSGAAACTACYPLDLIRTRLTVANSFGPTANNGAVYSLWRGGKIVGLIKDIVLKEGVGGLYRGLPVSIFVTAPNLAISFSVYGFVKEKLLHIGGVFTYMKKDPLYNNSNNNSSSNNSNSIPHLSVVGSLCSGCISGIASSCVIFPIDVVRKRMQVMGQLLPHTAQEQIGQEIIHNANANTIIEAIKQNEISGLHMENGAIHTTTNTTHTNIHITSTSTSTSTTSNTPTLNTTSTSATTRGNVTASASVSQCQAHSLHNSTSWQQAMHIYRGDGIRGFYRGLAPELLKVCPMVAIMYCSYEIVQETLNEHFPSV